MQKYVMIFIMIFIISVTSCDYKKVNPLVSNTISAEVIIEVNYEKVFLTTNSPMDIYIDGIKIHKQNAGSVKKYEMQLTLGKHEFHMKDGFYNTEKIEFIVDHTGQTFSFGARTKLTFGVDVWSNDDYIIINDNIENSVNDETKQSVELIINNFITSISESNVDLANTFISKDLQYKYSHRFLEAYNLPTDDTIANIFYKENIKSLHIEKLQIMGNDDNVIIFLNLVCNDYGNAYLDAQKEDVHRLYETENRLNRSITNEEYYLIRFELFEEKIKLYENKYSIPLTFYLKNTDDIYIIENIREELSFLNVLGGNITLIYDEYDVEY